MPFDHDYRFVADYTVADVVVAAAGAERAAALWVPTRLSHAYEVREVATTLANEALDAQSWRARRYWVSVVSATAMLHETISRGQSFEAVRGRADEATAMGVAAMTPDLREPPESRRQLLCNRIGLAPLHVQLLTLADLSVGWVADPETAHAVLSCLHLTHRLRCAAGILKATADAVGRSCGRKVRVR